MKYLYFGAHPDDAEEQMGGTAVKLVRAGHTVKFVAVCNGDCGHYDMKYSTAEGHAELAERRRLEAQASAKIAGVTEYQILNHHDCRAEASLTVREEIVQIIREFQPDVVISHRDCDYHADHRATGRLVMDAAYLLKVPLYCSDTPIPPGNPVFAYAYDGFTNPKPFVPDAAVEVESVMETKLQMMNCHASQYFEWLPWDIGQKDFHVNMDSWSERRNALLPWLDACSGSAAENARSLLLEEYGEKGRMIRYAESFQQSEYGEKVSPAEFRKLFLPEERG